MIFVKIAFFLVVLLILFTIYEVTGLIRKRANTYYRGGDGSFHAFGNTFFNIGSDCYIFHDNNQPSANRYQGNSNVENGLALINLRDDPSASDLELKVHKEGWVDLAGNIYDSSGTRVGYITDEKGNRSINGSGRWYELWLRRHSLVYTCPPLNSENGDRQVAQDMLVGKVIETGRLGKAKPNDYTITARAGGFLLLYKDRQPKPQDESAYANQTTWNDTALPATLIFTIVYALFYLTGSGKMTFPAFGEQLGFTAAMMLVYCCIWAILRQIKIEAALNGQSFDDFLMLIDRNTGVAGMNNWIIIAAATSLLVSIYIYGSDFVPLQMAILTGAWVNRKYITKEPWKLSDVEDAETSLPDWTDNGDDNGETETESRKYSWALDPRNGKLDGELTLTFNPESIAALRNANPFRLNPNRSFKANITELFDCCKDRKKVHEVLSYINKQIHKAGLGELDYMQFILDFVQKPNIEYEFDEKCEEIGCPRDYARYPDETMFDKRGDCDCKAALAAILFVEAGYKTAYLTTQNHAAIAVAFKGTANDDFVEMANQSLITKDGYVYFFCETTGDGFRIGDLGDTTKEAVEDIIFLN